MNSLDRDDFRVVRRGDRNLNHVSGTSFVRQAEELRAARESRQKTRNTALFRIDVIKVRRSPRRKTRKIVSSPRLFIDPAPAQ